LKLVILESRAKARTVKKYLGRGWIVEACNGHVQDLPTNDGTKNSSKALWASKPGKLPNPPWAWTERAESIIDKILRRAVSSGVNHVYIATDPDREGEFIAWRLSIIFAEFNEVSRVSFNEITKSAVTDAINSPRELDMDLVEAAMVRRFMDRLVGFRCSKFCRSWKLRSMGRVQTPTLGFVVNRELEREAHIPIEFHSVNMQSNGVDLRVNFHQSDDPDAWRGDDGKPQYDRTSNGVLAQNAHQVLANSRMITLSSVKEGTVKRKPYPPFTTDTLLQTANSSLGWPIGRTSRVATSLYQTGHITYIRTDSTRTSANSRSEIREIITERFGDEFLGDGVGEQKKKGSGKIQDAHEAIRPTNPKIDSVDLEADEIKLYGLIWARFAASQMSNSISERRRLSLNCDGLELEIVGTASWRTHAGWEKAFEGVTPSKAVTSPPSCGFDIGSEWKLDESPELVSDFTKPPRRLSESSIVQHMKQAGIGRPSTYVSTITKLSQKGYLDKEGSSLIPTENGRTLWLDVAPYYSESTLFDAGLFTTDFTAIMERSLDKIEIGEAESSLIWQDFEDLFRKMHNSALDKRRESPTVRQKEYLERLLGGMEESERSMILGGKSTDELTGAEAKIAIDKLGENGAGSISASEKQIGLIIKLVDKLDLQLSGFLSEMGHADISDLTGGRGGTASGVIEQLIALDNSSPATEKQTNAIRSMSEDLGISLDEAMEIVRVESIETISKSDASALISNLKKSIKASKRRKK